MNLHGRHVPFAVLALSLLAHAPLSLAADTTPFGSVAAGSADGKVCRWSAAAPTVPPSYQPGQPHVNVYAKDAPLERIDASQIDAHRAELADGVIALLQRYPSFFLRVFPCHRSHQLGEPYLSNSAWNDRHARLTANNEGLAAGKPGVLFRQPKSGLEVIWNHLTRLRGSLLDRTEVEAVVFENGSRKEFASRQEIAFPFNDPRRGEALPSALLMYSSSIVRPPKLAGGGFLLIDSLDPNRQPRLSWVYDQSQRRLRRLPGVEGDSVAGLAENLRTVDDTDMFNGSPNQYDWQILGRRALLVPYNNTALEQIDPVLDDLLTPYHLNPDRVRWERHRVIVVEGRLKPGERHIYQRRVMYVDEDSWSILIAENYDHEDTLWRVSLAHPAPFYEVPMTMTVADVFHDLRLKRYNVKGLVNSEAGPGKYTLPFPADGYFTPNAFRQRFTR